MTSKTLTVILLLAFSLSALGSLEVNSVFSRDAGKEINNIRIGLSEAATYRVESSSDGKTHRVVVLGAQNSVTRPDYQRLSPVIDQLSSYQQGGNTIVEVRTMQASRLSHSLSSSGIILQLNQGNAQVPVTEPKADKAASRPAPKPRRIRTPQASETPTVAVPESISSSSEADSVPAPVPAPKPEVPAKPNYRDPRLLAFVRANLLWMLLLLAGIFLLIVAIRIGHRVPRLKEVPDAEPSPPLIMESSTRQRMVMRLVEQGWTAAQVATELRIPVKEVERIIAAAKQRPEL